MIFTHSKIFSIWKILRTGFWQKYFESKLKNAKYFKILFLQDRTIFIEFEIEWMGEN